MYHAFPWKDFPKKAPQNPQKASKAFQRVPKELSKGLQRVPNAIPRTPQVPSKASPNPFQGPKLAPRPPQGLPEASRTDFCSILGAIFHVKSLRGLAFPKVPTKAPPLRFGFSVVSTKALPLRNFFGNSSCFVSPEHEDSAS